MEIQEAVELFRENTDEKNRTWGQDRPKINRFIAFVGGNTDAQEAISESNLVGFFETLDRNLSGYYFTLKKFYTFVQGKVLSLPISERKVFPLEVPKDMNLEGNSRKPKANYLPKGFDFYQLFNEDFYVHLHNETASRTIMACMAVGLGAGYNTQDIIDMTLGDIQVNGDTIRVKNVYETESVPWIVLTGELAKFIKGYYDLRMKHANSSSEATTQLFFEKYWNGRELEVEPDIAGVKSNGVVDKPSKIIALMTYMLRYISFKVDIDPHLYPTHLYINTILHQLIQTDGKALESIIRTFGWERTFVRESFYQYVKYQELKESIGFNPFDSDSPSDFNADQDTESEEQSDFFPKSSSDDDTETDEDILIIEFLKRRKRDTKRVRDLKRRYRNCCQICGEALVDINGVGYSEVNHIQPLSKHKGVDREVNMIVLCPNHHTLMDMGIITIDPRDRVTILHVDENNSLHLAKLVMVNHLLSEKCVQYHHDIIFNSMKEKINRRLQEKTIKSIYGSINF